MSAKDTLIQRAATMEATLSLPQLINGSAGNTQQNSCATLLRKGLGIVVFNILEDYIKERTTEMFMSVSASLTSFTHLTDELREAATLGALKGLTARALLEKKAQGDWLTLIQTESMNINSTSLINGFTISNYSLMAEGSNIYADDIPKALKCLNIEGGWNTLQQISNLTNGGIANLKQSFVNLATRRHKAAHVANFDYEHGWLTEAVKEIFALACAYDIALTSQCRALISNPSTALTRSSVYDNITCRFLIHNPQKNHYSERSSLSATKAVKNWSNYSTAIQNIAPWCRAKDQYLISLNSQQRISNWYC